MDTKHAKKKIIDKYYPPNMKYNFLNVGKLLEHNNEIIFKKDASLNLLMEDKSMAFTS